MYGSEEFNKKVVVITGGGGGMGRVFSVKYASLGAKVAIIDYNESYLNTASKELLAVSDSVVAIRCDVTKEQEVRESVERVVSKFGGIDILINAAGIQDVDLTIPIVEQKVDRWDFVINVNLRGTYMFSKECAGVMIKNKYGKIVNISSTAGVVGFPRETAYGPSKSGVIMLTKQFAYEWARYNINVNAIAPGFIRTEMLEKIIKGGNLDEQQLIKKIPKRRLGEPEEVADLALFLTSEHSKYITGETIVIDGGWTTTGNI